MLAKLRAWRELLKLGNLPSIGKEMNTFYRGNVIRVLDEEGWFQFLSEPKTVDEIRNEFHYTDPVFLKEILDAMVEDGTLKAQDDHFKLQSPLNNDWVLPRIYNESARVLWQRYASAIPDRLRGKYLAFTGGMNLFDWDDTLIMQFYEQVRRSAFAFAGLLKKPGTLLDVGCGNGNGTAAIWGYYYNLNQFYPNSPVKITGMELDENLFQIAQTEFFHSVRRNLGNVAIDADILEQFSPEFVKGTIEEIPFPDNQFDAVYASFVLNWANTSKALKEMLRVTKPNGIAFGVHGLYPKANKYSGIHCRVVENATGFCYKDEFVKWAKEAGGKKVSFATPISMFKIEK